MVRLSLVSAFFYVFICLSCTYNRGLESKNVTVDNYEWGEQKMNLLGALKVDTVTYQVSNVIREIQLVDGFKTRAFLLLESNDITYSYEAENPKDLPQEIKKNKLIFYFEKDRCEEEINEIVEEALCFKCLDGKCFLKQFNPKNE